MKNAGDDARPGAIAVIGMSGRFPGAKSPSILWTNIRDGVEGITFLTDDQLIAAGVPRERLSAPDYVKACGRLDDIEHFDAGFFGMSPRDAAVFDPQHRLFLECAWEAFEHAGYVGEQFDGPVAVFASSGAPEYFMHNLLRSRKTMESVGAWLVRHNGNDQNFLATRVSYELNLTGPSVTVQSACSSSLLAVHMAAQSLLSGECDMALAGGATVYVEQNHGYTYKPNEILSPDGHCRAFDAKAAGTVMASAVGCVILRRYDDAVRDGDRILAVVRGSAVNNDGAQKVGYLAPSVAGQTRVVSEALAVAGVHPDEVSYVEAHGTGTLIGDPIEITALTDAYRAVTDRKQYCAIGSLKSNIGHAGEAAGICGFIKTVMALQHRQIPPSLHFETPNPQLDLANSPFFVNDRLRDWTTPEGQPRIAGVTGLGAGGTNVHVLVEEAPEEPRGTTPARPHQLIVLSARTPSALDAATQALAAHLRAHPETPLADVAYTLLAGRKRFAHRRVLVARDVPDAIAALEAADRKRLVTHHQKDRQVPPVFFMFPGGGAQYAGMGAELYEREAVYREAFDAALAHVEPALRAELRAIALATGSEAAPASQRLEAPSRALPLLFVTEYAVGKLLASWGIEPAAMIGHSAGEYAVACLAGVLSLRDAVALASLRGRLFETLPEGGMLSVQLPADEALAIAGPKLSLAAVNAPSLCVLSGPTGAIASAEAALRERGVECTRVHIRVAAHSSMLDAILPEFEAFCRTVSFRRPEVPFVSSVTGTWIADAEATDPAYWVRHLRSTVRFADGMQTLLEAGEIALCEVGPGRALSSLSRQQPGTFAIVTPTLRHAQEDGSDVAFLLGAVGRLWAAGVPLDVARLFAGETRRREALPTYPFERQRYWIDPDPRDDRGHGEELRKRADVTEWFAAPAWARSAMPARAAASAATWLVFADDTALSAAMLDVLRGAGHRVVVVEEGTRFADHGSFRFNLDPSVRSHFDELGRSLRAAGVSIDGILHLWALAPRPRRGGLLRRGQWDPLASYDDGLARHYYSLVFAAQVFAGDAEALRLVCVSSQMQAVPGDADVHAEKAVVLGPCKVIPHEYPQVRCVSIDVAAPVAGAERQLAERLLREIDGDSQDTEIALRGTDRWIRRFDPVRLSPAADERPWLRHDGVYLLTGGLGGIALQIADHLASHASVKLALVGRTALPDETLWEDWLATHAADDETSRRIRAVSALRARGTEVIAVAADVTDMASMQHALERVHERFGPVNGVFHAAGTLKDEIIALRAPVAKSAVIDAKMKGALVLDAVLAAEPLDFFVLFSSVASMLGLPGQADYTAANAFLDAMAHARAGRGVGRTLTINWNAWQDVGMLATHVKRARAEESAAAPAAALRAGTHPALEAVIVDDPTVTVFRTAFSRERSWLLAEHVVRNGEALISGTGMIEIARAALAERPEAGSAELRDVFFLQPFSVAAGTERTLHVRVERGGDAAFAIYGGDEQETFVVGKARYVEAAPAGPIDVDAIRARCTRAGAVDNGQLVQHFMDFGPRWGCASRIDLGTREALVSLELPAGFAGDLDQYQLHPAMLDLATGGAQAIVPGFDPRATFYVPFSYGRVVVHRPMTARAVSHVRLREATGESVIFDATLADDRGAVIATIEGFVMRKSVAALSSAPARRPSAAVATAERRPETPSEAALREGMTPSEGVDALDRLMLAPVAPQMIACTMPLTVWIDQLDREARASLGGSEDDQGPVFARPNVGASMAPPRDDVERELAALWKSLLGVAEVGINDDFFELGGQSLVAVRLFQRIGKKYGVELPLSTLFQAPTIADCATVLRQTLGLPHPDHAVAGDSAAAPAIQPQLPAVTTRPEFRCLVTIQSGRGRLPFFCVHGAGGNVLNFRDLARTMHPDQPFYGLQASGIDGVSPLHTTVEEMAAAYTAEMRQAQPTGPYLIGGYSGGGLVAFEMARQLTAAGEEVGLLAFIDTFHPDMPVKDVTVLSRLGRLQREGVTYIRKALDTKRRNAQAARDEKAIADHLARGEAIPFELRELYIWRNFERAQAQYRLQPWEGTATLFRAEEIDEYFFEGSGPSYGWDRHVRGGVEVMMVPGDHHNLLLGTNAALLGGWLNDAIERAAAAARRVGANLAVRQAS